MGYFTLFALKVQLSIVVAALLAFWGLSVYCRVRGVDDRNQER